MQHISLRVNEEDLFKHTHMKPTFFCLAACALLATACGEGGKTNTQGVNIANMDQTAAPGTNFYRYASGGWIDNHPMKPEFSRYGVMDALRENSQEQVKELIAQLAALDNADGSIAQKIGDLYKIALDSVRLNADGAAPLKPYLDEVNALQEKAELGAFLAKAFRNGTNGFFGGYVHADNMNSSMNIFHIRQGGYSMGDRDYYIEKDARSEELRTKYAALISQLFTLSGYSEQQAADAVKAVMAIETRLATASYPRVKLRIPMDNYHMTSLADMQKNSPAIDWKAFFSALGLSQLDKLNLAQPEPLKEVSNVIASTSLEDIKYYLAWKVILGSSSCLSDDFNDATFEFFGKTLSGQQEQQARWKRAVNVVNGNLGEAVGQIYVETYFPAAHKERMLELVSNLQVALGERIQALPWMGDATKEKALEKLATFHVKIGYPDKWRDYSALTVNATDSYLDNVVRSNQFDTDYMLSQFDQPVDKDQWLMTPQTVNAYYSPTTNEICFPAAILQPPFFNMQADDAVNYGAIGVVIGHEMTHGFDDSGRLYDKDGNLSSWWTDEDSKNFEARADVLVNYFDNIIVIDTVHANGRFTLGENIADQGGLHVSWQAYQNTLKDGVAPEPINGFTDAQRFFIGYASIWAGDIRNEEILRLTKMDPHSLAIWRVNGALPHVDKWYEAFDIQESDPLFIPKEERASIW